MLALETFLPLYQDHFAKYIPTFITLGGGQIAELFFNLYSQDTYNLRKEERGIFTVLIEKVKGS